MAGITGQGTTFNLPNFVGDLFSISTEDTPLLSAIGGLTGGRPAYDKRFEWEFYDLRDADTARQRLEGAAPPTAEQRVRANASNVVEIHQEAVEVSYTRQALANRGGFSTTARGTSPVVDELAWQMDKQLLQVARDVESGFINGTYQSPADNATPRKTRGLLQAIATNVITVPATADAGGDVTGVAATDIVTTASAHGLAVGDSFQFTTLNGGAGAAAATRYFVVDVPSTTTFLFSAARGGTALNFTTAITTGSRISIYPKVSNESIGNAMQLAFDNGGLMIGETRTAIVGSLQKRRLSKALITDVNYREVTRNVGGVNLTLIETDFGPLNVMVDRYMPAGTIAFVSLEDLAPRFLEIPGKGYFFWEPLAKTAASDASQLYGEIGLEYGNERKHAVINGLG